MNQISAGGVVIKNNKVLILRQYSGVYCLPKGRIEWDETVEKAAIREVKEETNIDAEIVQYIGKIAYAYFNYQKKLKVNKEVYWFLMRPTTFNIKPQTSEGFKYAYFLRLNDAARRLTFKAERQMLKDAMRLYRSDR